MPYNAMQYNRIPPSASNTIQCDTIRYDRGASAVPHAMLRALAKGGPWPCRRLQLGTNPKFVHLLGHVFVEHGVDGLQSRRTARRVITRHVTRQSATPKSLGPSRQGLTGMRQSPWALGATEEEAPGDSEDSGLEDWRVVLVLLGRRRGATCGP